MTSAGYRWSLALTGPFYTIATWPCCTPLCPERRSALDMGLLEKIRIFAGISLLGLTLACTGGGTGGAVLVVRCAPFGVRDALNVPFCAPLSASRNDESNPGGRFPDDELTYLTGAEARRFYGSD